MGLTHYWRRPSELPADRFAAAVRDVERVVAATGVGVAGFEGVGQPVFQVDAIVFNGTRGSAVEPFEIHQTEFDRRGRTVVSSYCKTENAPYDACVRVALVVLKRYFPDLLDVSSDSGEDGWTEARALCQRVLGYGDDFALTT